MDNIPETEQGLRNYIKYSENTIKSNLKRNKQLENDFLL